MNFNSQYSPRGFGFMPTVTKNIIIINVILYLLTIALIKTVGYDLTNYFGLHYFLAPNFKPHQFITYIFMHSTTDIRHILFNMLGVYVFGQALEQLWGPKRYLIFYLLTGLGAALAQYVIMYFEVAPFLEAINNDLLNADPHEKISILAHKGAELNKLVIVGASGSLFGLLGAFGMLFPNTELLIYFLFPVKAKWLVIAYGAIELFSGLRNNPMDNVAHFAHLGGLAVGIALVIYWRRKSRQFY